MATETTIDQSSDTRCPGQPDADRLSRAQLRESRQMIALIWALGFAVSSFVALRFGCGRFICVLPLFLALSKWLLLLRIRKAYAPNPAPINFVFLLEAGGFAAAVACLFLFATPTDAANSAPALTFCGNYLLGCIVLFIADAKKQKNDDKL